MTALSVNVNKIATLRNARGGNVPDLIKCSLDIEQFGAQGITIHPRPDERHIRYQDARDLKKVIQTELNIEGNPNEKFIALVDEVQPAQVTLVPDAVDAITSDAGWDTIKNEAYLTKIVKHFKDQGIRTSIFVDPTIEMVEGAAKTGVDRIELYTEAYAQQYPINKESAVAPYVIAAQKALELGLGINAGHDLSLENMRYFKDNVPGLLEVSIGHALISESLYMGLENVVNMYKSRLTD
ncbi:pyridoxine 5'-phosphate synthase [Nonlabens ulvanivorans]|uniref:Pyridoxine 5'-phosphate synthase n=1 Tax=Nonlabens ulvanivorans TaxID=906888 RepID=A0A090Q5R3_NONUL|nr:pyridoxine 5'-phosphate synthase [Nonlabens ulvanivorans]GAK98355.1 pyridoxine 5'-phosphate synthase [Nonlabens ulvanivorans]